MAISTLLCGRCNNNKPSRDGSPRQKEEAMFKLVWIERPLGLTIIKTKTFPDREARFRYILMLERTKSFDRVIEMN